MYLITLLILYILFILYFLFPFISNNIPAHSFNCLLFRNLYNRHPLYLPWKHVLVIDLRFLESAFDFYFIGLKLVFHLLIDISKIVTFRVTLELNRNLLRGEGWDGLLISGHILRTEGRGRHIGQGPYYWIFFHVMIIKLGIFSLNCVTVIGFCGQGVLGLITDHSTFNEGLLWRKRH